MLNIRHVLPIGDLREHEESQNCWEPTEGNAKAAIL